MNGVLHALLTSVTLFDASRNLVSVAAAAVRAHAMPYYVDMETPYRFLDVAAMTSERVIYLARAEEFDFVSRVPASVICGARASENVPGRSDS